MGQVFAGLFLLYAVTAMALMPLVAVEGYLKNRDCKVLHKVERCVITYVPAADQREGGPT